MRYVWMLAVLVLLGVAALSGCAGKTADTDVIDGGVVHNDNVDAPKTIVSKEIVSFSCEFSTLTLMEETELENDVFCLEAALSDGVVTGTCSSREIQKQTFEADASFMKRLQEIAEEYDFAQYNGMQYRVSGLPDQFGAKLNILYESGEQIYASNNQDCFLTLAAMEELFSLFREQIQQS